MKPKSIIMPIAVAEGASTLVSLGAVLAITRHESSLNPARDFIAKHFIYPAMAHKAAPAGIDTSDPLFNKACDQATLLVKGGVMLGAGFASHIPIQLALEGHFDPSSVKHVVLGKSAGIGVALGSILLVNKIMPKLLPSVQKVICPVISPYLPQGCDHGSTEAKEVCHLMTVEIPSSIISGFINYGITKRGIKTH